MAKIWTKSNQEETTDAKTFCEFTTGNDYQLDQSYFFEYDIEASKVWAEAIRDCGIYTEDECKFVTESLDTILTSYRNGGIRVEPEDEDCHTTIEKWLTKLTGNLGKKIHTGRSRNDQSLTMVRMFMRNALIDISVHVTRLSSNIARQSGIWGSNKPFIGYSHTQQAMPITIGHYFGSFTESFSDDNKALSNARCFINKCPLGTGAGFGSPLEVDRLFIADKLKFDGFINNSLHTQNTRGKYELIYLQAISQVMLTLQRMANDMILYTTREFGLFKMSDSLSQGSSMMPQKKNPDVFEIIRAKAADVLSLEERVKLIIKGLPSGYNRDLQEIKACVVDAYNITKNCLYIMNLAIEHIEPDHDKIEQRLESDIVATDYIIGKCIQDPGLNFRDMYKDFTEGNYASLKPEDAIRLRKSKGSPSNL
jgi:argininosuccinate lyase